VVGWYIAVPLAYGSMVLYLYCVSFFRPAGEKMIHKELKIIGKRKSYLFVWFLSLAERQKTTQIEESTALPKAKQIDHVSSEKASSIRANYILIA
jgi:hypothetical protein